MSKDSKLGKMKSFITSLFGVKEYKLNSEGHLDMKEEEIARLTETYGADFVSKFEKMLADEGAEVPENGIQAEEITDTKQTTDMNLKFLCALLAIDAISLVDGKVSLSEEQLNKVEARLKILEDAKAAAESSLTTANTDKDVAVAALSAATKAMDELGATVKAATTPEAKVEAIRLELAKKPGSAAEGIQTKADEGTRAKIEGADPINAAANELIN